MFLKALCFNLGDKLDCCVHSSGLIFFFVKTDVELHPGLDSIPLLIDRVSAIEHCTLFLPPVSGTHFGFALRAI